MVRGSWLEVVAFAGMAMAELVDVGISTVSKAAMSKGMSPFVYVVYINALGTLFLLLPFILYRPKHQPLTYKILGAFFLLGLIGIGFAQVIWYTGIRYSSPTLSYAMSNLIPAFIFILAIIFSGWFYEMMIMTREGSWLEVMAFAGMTMVELVDVGISTVSKAAMSKGMSPFVYVVYINALGTLFLLLPFILYRPKHKPITYKILGAFFLLGLIGVGFVQVFWYTGIRYSSPTLSSAMINLTPAYIFVFAIIFRMERLDLKATSSQAKVIGTLVSITGALTVTLYKGSPIMFTTTSSHSNWVIGGFLLSFGCFMISVWYILLAATIKEYPSDITVIFFYSFFGTIQCAIITSFIETDPNAWKLKSGLELTAVAIAAVFGSVFRTGVHMWGIHKKGPVYVAMFRPLGIVFAIIMGVTFLGDTLYIGSVVGATVIVSGFYAVMWGKAKEEKGEDEYDVVGSNSESCTVSQKLPLLQSNEMNI